MLSAAVLVLVLFLILTSFALEQAFRDAARAAREERLLGQIYFLMAVAELDGATLIFPESLAEPRLNLPRSGLYAQVLGEDGGLVWASRSAMTTDVPPLASTLASGEQRSRLLQDDGGILYLVQSFGVTWATGDEPHSFTFAVAEDLAALNEELNQFRRSLATSFGAMGAVLIAALFVLLRWGLRPLRRVAAEVAAIESGSQEMIHGDYPTELQGLTHNLNALLAHEQAQRRRLDQSFGDLAHSLKTPLAVLRVTERDAALSQDVAAVLGEQLARMEHIVDYQLKRARSAATAAAGLAPPIPVRPAVDRVVGALNKVYRDKDVHVTVVCDAGKVFRGSDGDLLEVIGNLLDNAFKWSRTQVRVTVTDDQGLRLRVEDDGPGIPADRRRQLVMRGVRADELAPGHGLGLAMTKELCAAYGGQLELGGSPLGGACVEAKFASPAWPP